MKHRIAFLTALALLCLLPACAGPFRSASAAVPASPDLFPASDLVGTWYIHEIFVDSASASSVIQWAMVEIAADGAGTAYVTKLDGNETHTFAVTINSEGEIFFDGTRKAVMSYDKKQIIGSELVETYAGLFIGERAVSAPDFSQADCEGDWRVHSLQAGSGWEGWKVVEGSIDAAGGFTGTQTDSDGGSGAYTATATIESDGDMTITEPGNSLQGHSAMSAGRLLFGSLTGAIGAEQIGRFDVGVRTGGDFITADLEGKWWFQTIDTDGHISYGFMDCPLDGTLTGESTYPGGPISPMSGSMGVTPSGAMSMTIAAIGPLNGTGTLGLDRSFFTFTFSNGSERTMILATKHPVEVSSTVDVTHVAMDWGNGFSFDDPMDLDTEDLPCGLPGVWVDQSYFQAVPPPPQGSSVQAAYVYGQDSDLVNPTFEVGKLILPSSLSSGGDRTRCRFMPELAMDSMSWPDRTGDIELRATFDNFQGDLAPLMGNGFRGVDLGFSVSQDHQWWGDAWVSFGFVTVYLTEAVGDLEPGYYNREPFLSFGSYVDGNEDSTVMPAEGYDPLYPVELKVLITSQNAVRYYAHFGPPQAEWTLLGEGQLDWWPGDDTPAAGCGTGDHSSQWYYNPYISSTLEYLNTSGDSGALEIVTDSLPDGTAGDPYDQTLEATGGEPPYDWQIVSGNLPPGISLSEDGDLSGTCFDAGIYTFTVRVTDSADPSATDQQELTLTVNDNLYEALAGEWRFHGITVDKAASAANTFYGSAVFDMEGNVAVRRFELDGTYTDFSFPYFVATDGQITVDDSPFGTLSFDGKLIVANGYTDDEGTLSVFTKASDGGDSFSQFDAEGDWAIHSFEVGPDWQGWMAMFGNVDDSGSFYGSRDDSDGGSDSYEATLAMEDDPPSFTEPDNSLLQHFGMTDNRLAFSTIMGDMADPGIGRLDVGIRTGGDFLTEDLQGKWWFYGISNSGSVFRGWMLVDSEGTATGEDFDSFRGTTEPLEGTISVTPEGEITIEISGEELDGHFTLGMDRAFFAGTSSDGDDRSMMVATKRTETIISQVDVTRVYMDWGNGFGFDDPLTLDTLGNPCGIPGMSVHDSYFVHPVLPEGGVASALYGFWDFQDAAAPSFEDGKLVFTSAIPPSGDELTAGMSPQISLNNVPWEPQNSNAELRVTFGNIQGALVTMAGYGGVALDIGFRVSDGDNEVGTVWAQLAITTAYLKRGFGDVEQGYYNRQPFAIMGNDGDENWGYQVSPATDYDPDQPTELKITVSPYGEAEGYVRFGSEGEWIGIGNMQLSFWPEPGAWTSGCYSPSFPPGTLRYTPYVAYRLENVGLPGDPSIMPETLPDGIVGSDYEQQLYSEDGFPPFEWWIEDGELPPGLDLDQDGLISGTLEEAGSYQFTVRVEDSQSPSAWSEHDYTIVVIQPVSIEDAKALPDGTQVALTDVVVSRKGQRGFYVEEPDRSAGIYVKWASGFVAEGWTVQVEGVLETDDDFERRVVASDVRRVEDELPMIRPVGMAIRNLGGSDFRVDPESPTTGQRGVTGGAGLSNIGLLVKTWGRVTQIDPDGQYFYISDGSTVMDGTQTGGVDNEGVRVGRDPLGLRPGDYLTVVGISSCFRGPGDTVCRGIRGQDMSPSIQVHFPGPPEFVLGMPGQDPLNSCTIIFSSVLGATGYRLYQSTDGVDYSPVSGEPDMQGDYGIFMPSLSGNTYFQVCALDGDGDEGARSQTVYARVQDPAGSVSLTAPPNGQTDAPLDPSVCWDPVPGAVRMGIEIYHEDGSHQTDWGAFFPAGDGCVPYGQMGRPITYAPALDVLEPFTDYWVYVYAIDSGNWAFASSEYVPFTTGDGTGGGGGVIPPPPPPI